MNKKTQAKKPLLKRFWWLFLLSFILLVAAIIFFSILPKNDQGNNQRQKETFSDSPPVLKNLAIEFAPYDPVTGRAGAFKFVDQGQLGTIFWEFGTILAKGTNNEHINPTFEYDTAPNAQVMAAADGIVVEMKYQDDTKDYEIYTAPARNSHWIVSYDHVTNPTVKKLDSVIAGKIIGTVGTWSNGLGRVELTVSKSDGQKYYSYCPLSYMDPALKTEYEQKVSRLMSDYESWMKKTTIYDEANDKLPGCIYSTVFEEEGSSRGAQPVN